jgi:N-acetylglutamate synthase-like GNAT family acetyltransferase
MLTKQMRQFERWADEQEKRKAKREQWVDEYKCNSAIKEVIWKSTEYQGEGWVAVSKSTMNFNRFLEKVKISIKHTSFDVYRNMVTDQLIQYAHQNKEYRTYKVRNEVDKFIVITSEDWHLHLYPYHDGVMIYTINVNEDKRGNGIGTELLNKLYDISENLNVPLYLIPYPDYEFLDKTDMEKELINKLKNYYNRIGFGPVSEDSLVYCNFE